MDSLVADNYGWSSGQPEHSHGYLLPTAVNALKSVGAVSMLDIGTGNGATIPIWLSNGFKVSAMEPDEQGYLFARKHSDADVRNLGVGQELPSEWKNSFDAVVSLEVVEHLFDPAQLVTTANEALRKEGIIVVSTPYHGYWKNLALAIGNKWDFHHHPTRVGGHIKFWSRQSLTTLFLEGGFKEVSFTGVGRVPFVWKSMIMVFKKG